MRPKPVVLAILDGWGERIESENNAIAQANTPNWDRFRREFPFGQINASELHVGLPEGQMGNSEVGHMNIGSGRVVMQDLPKIDKAIADGSLAKNPQLLEFIAKLKKSGGTCHLMGLLSDGGVHSHMTHMAALAKIVAAADIEVKVHAFLDGRDVPPKSAMEYVASHQLPVASICGRYYAMDRDKRWDRVQKAYETLATGKGERFKTAEEAVKKSYADSKTDEFVLPCVIGDYDSMHDGDGILMANFRADRVREILTALLDPAFKEFPTKKIHFAAALGICEYSEPLNKFMPALFPPEKLEHILAEVVANAGLTQLHIAETEKYAHVTFFFNGGREDPFAGEERILIPSPKVATYDLKPEMSAYEVTEKLVEAINANRFDFIVVNYANTDMVGHSGDIKAAIKAVEAVDACLGKVADAVLAKGGALLVTADHGNAEMMFDHDTDQAHTAHTLNLVPAIVIREALRRRNKHLPEGKLADIAPTLLQLLELPKPPQMTGVSLLADIR